MIAHRIYDIFQFDCIQVSGSCALWCDMTIELEQKVWSMSESQQKKFS